MQCTPLSAAPTQHMWKLLAGKRTSVLPWNALERRISISANLCANKFNKTNLGASGRTAVRISANNRLPASSPLWASEASRAFSSGEAVASPLACLSRYPPNGQLPCRQATTPKCVVLRRQLIFSQGILW